MVASPTYERCGTLEPSPTFAFLISTNAPAFAPVPRTVPLRKYEYGPTFALAPIVASKQFDSTMFAPSSTLQDSSVVRGPITAPVAIFEDPKIAVPGKIVTSFAISAVASIQVVVGSTMVTPARMKPSLMRSRSKAALSANCTRSLTPKISMKSSISAAAIVPPSLRRISMTSVR